MPRCFRPFLLLCFSLLNALPAAAQSNSMTIGKALVGAWRIEVPASNDPARGLLTGTLTIASEGDSLVATLAWVPGADGVVYAPRRIVGRVQNGRAVFVQRQQATLSADGYGDQRGSTSTWQLQAAGDVLSGTVTHEVEMMSLTMEPMPVRGTRASP